jgi:DNA repair exonuclease SbcCD ATPase subunit
MNIIPLLNVYNEMKTELDITINLHNKISNKYVNMKRDYEKELENEKKIEMLLKDIKYLRYNLNLFEEMMRLLGNYREWLYKNKILPSIKNYVNFLVKKMEGEKKLNLEVIYENNNLNWEIEYDGVLCNIEKASGYQRFIIGFAMRIALSKLGISNLFCKQLFIDEGFTACDREHIKRVPLFIKSLLGMYDNIMLVTHLIEIKESANVVISIEREGNKSKLGYGTKVLMSGDSVLL